MTDKEKHLLADRVIKEYSVSRKFSDYKRLLYTEKNQLLQILFYNEPFTDIHLDPDDTFIVHVSLYSGRPCGWTQAIPREKIKELCPGWLD